MDTKKQLEERIANAEAELAEMRELLEKEENKWRPQDIRAGVVAKGPDTAKVVVLQWGWAKFAAPTRFYLGGLCSSVLEPFSSFADGGGTAEDVANLFNLDGYRKLGNLETNFNQL
jgi:hypothetical protein